MMKVAVRVHDRGAVGFIRAATRYYVEGCFVAAYGETVEEAVEAWRKAYRLAVESGDVVIVEEP